MAVSFQLVIDCADPEPLARFWAAALGYELEPPPDGFASWDAYRRDLGVPEDELGTGADCIADPGASAETPHMPRILRQVRHDVVVSAAGCRIGEHVGQRRPQVDQSHRTV